MADKENAKEELKGLIARYETTLSGGKVKQYNEERTKKDFILPLFKILGWATETEEVTAEDKVSKGRVDYGFRVNEFLKLVVEAKPLRADLDKPEYAEQAVDYAWHKGISWAVLTNFEKIILFNADLKLQNPLQSAKLRLSYKQFLDRFEDLWLLSKESVESGALEAWGQRYAVGPKKVDVGEQILADLMGWREWLTKDINKHPDNRKVASTEEELDEAVQRILDRLIFIRTCEDREFEEKLLHQLLEEWRSSSRKSLFAGLMRIFEYFNENYDSKLFLPHSCDKLSITNEVIAAVIEGLYRTKDKSIRYDFSLIEADVLGSIYENYLGHVLRQTAKRVKVADTPNHRKQLGIYYTPTYIVDYIVKNTLGELLKGKKAEEIKDIKVLDPACGSGSFLIKAFDTISEAYKQKNGEELPFDKKKDILTNNIFGVDLDPKAVEIAQLNLMLKAVEKKKLLPMLQNNVKNGNSLIDDPAIAGDKAFKWEEQFSGIIKRGGFDVVVGNPPYGALFNTDEKRYFDSNYSYVKSIYESYRLFIEKALNLVKANGCAGLIIPNTWFYLTNAEQLRKELLSNFSIIKLINLPQSVFEDATVDTCILILRRVKSKEHKIKACFFPYKEKITNLESLKYSTIEQTDLLNAPASVINLKLSVKDISLISKIKKQPCTLNDYVKIITGIKPYQIGKGIPPQTKKLVEEKPFTALTQKDGTFKPWLTGKFISRYAFFSNKEFIKYGKWLAEPKTPEIFETDRIVLQQIRNPSLPRRIIATLIRGGIYTNNGIHNLLLKDRNKANWVLGILNSKLMNFYFSAHYNDVNIKPSNLYNLPYPKYAELSNISKLAHTILQLNEKVKSFKDKQTDEKLRVQEEIKRNDAEIDRLVYELYGITDDEKKIIEASLK